jgi:hypothetical protein
MAIVRIRRFRFSAFSLRLSPFGELGVRMARCTCVAGLVQGTDKVSVACGSL